MYRVSLGIIFIVALCTAALLHAEPGHCFFEPRPCEDWNDSSHAERLPDSLQTTLQEKLDSDTGSCSGETPTSLNGFATRKTAKKILFQIQ